MAIRVRVRSSIFAAAPPSGSNERPRGPSFPRLYVNIKTAVILQSFYVICLIYSLPLKKTFLSTQLLRLQMTDVPADALSGGYGVW